MLLHGSILCRPLSTLLRCLTRHNIRPLKVRCAPCSVLRCLPKSSHKLPRLAFIDTCLPSGPSLALDQHHQQLAMAQSLTDHNKQVDWSSSLFARHFFENRVESSPFQLLTRGTSKETHNTSTTTSLASRRDRARQNPRFAVAPFPQPPPRPQQASLSGLSSCIYQALCSCLLLTMLVYDNG